MCNMKRQDKKGYCTKYSTARRITCSEDNEATTHMVRACDKNGRRTITAERVTLSSRRRKKSGSTTKITDDVHQRRLSKIKAHSKQWNLQESERQSCVAYFRVGIIIIAR